MHILQRHGIGGDRRVVVEQRAREETQILWLVLTQVVEDGDATGILCAQLHQAFGRRDPLIHR